MEKCKFTFTDKLELSGAPFSQDLLYTATVKTNEYLKNLPKRFESSYEVFYTTLNQRNLSGFVGEVLKYAIRAQSSDFVPNPHPDGRPDILDLRNPKAKAHFHENCFSGNPRAPIRDRLAPFTFGGVEIKATIGNTPNGSDFKIGKSRSDFITGLNYWAHHAHACELLAVYYDFCRISLGVPQVKALFFCKLEESDWQKVSIGRPERKKTSNTSLNASGLHKLKKAMVMHSSEAHYITAFQRLRLM